MIGLPTVCASEPLQLRLTTTDQARCSKEAREGNVPVPAPYLLGRRCGSLRQTTSRHFSPVVCAGETGPDREQANAGARCRGAILGEAVWLGRRKGLVNECLSLERSFETGFEEPGNGDDRSRAKHKDQ